MKQVQVFLPAGTAARRRSGGERGEGEGGGMKIERGDSKSHWRKKENTNLTLRIPQTNSKLMSINLRDERVNSGNYFPLPRLHTGKTNLPFVSLQFHFKKGVTSFRKMTTQKPLGSVT